MIERTFKGFVYLISRHGTLFRYKASPVVPAAMLDRWKREAREA